MQITVEAKDWAIAILALIGAALSAVAILAVLVRVLGRRLPEIEEEFAAALLRDAAGWRARHERKEELAAATARLEMAPAAVEAE